MEIRASRPIDRSAIEALYPAAFPDEELLPIVRALFATESRVLSLAGMIDAVLVGHVLFMLRHWYARKHCSTTRAACSIA